MSEDQRPVGGGSGIRSISGETFSLQEAVGGWRGAVESVLPGVLFVVVFVASGQQLTPALIAAAACAVIAVVARLVQRSPLTQAFSGVLGVGVGVIWAWRTGEASDYFAWGLLVNVGYLAGFLVSILIGWPLVGLVLGLFRPEGPLNEGGSWAGALAWRRDRALRRRFAAASWVWVGMFALRLVVQGPLYLADQVGWLGTAKLVMGLPLTALVLWVSWILVRGTTAAPPAPAPTRRDP
ncbi:DUF3159 domain-containing protein [Cellulomonas fimi]|uniref:DUF3159 domain-containing protein n=1 Tax=Cellulomonas sp. RIT-PI-Y TaxID=3035297 RepID=UPI0021D81D0A